VWYLLAVLSRLQALHRRLKGTQVIKEEMVKISKIKNPEGLYYKVTLQQFRQTDNDDGANEEMKS
jgi:hypothetical protein